MEIPFPFAGLHEGIAAERQPPTTSPHLMNIRPVDVDEERIRGGQRPGLAKAYTTQIGGEYPVTFIGVIATTYIEPV